jgi:hypothetical protein
MDRMLDRSWPYLVAGAVIGSSVAAVLTTWFFNRKRGVTLPPATMKPPPFDPSAIPVVPAERLALDSIERFIVWVASVPVAEAQRVRDAIAPMRDDEVLVGSLLSKLFDLPVRDFGRHHLLLSILGELGNVKAVDPLARFVDLPADAIFGTVPTTTGGHAGPATTYVPRAVALQSRAVEMLAAIRNSEAFEKVLTLASQHHSAAVRIAALNAFVYHNGDSAEAMERARAAARPREARYVGLPRLERGGNRREFETKVREFYERYPDELPPSPRGGRHDPHGGNPPAARSQ